jgi:PAS domain S-box-containing protein
MYRKTTAWKESNPIQLFLYEAEGTITNQSTNLPPSENKGRQYRAIFDAVSDGIILNDLETGQVLEANPAAWQMHGYSRDRFIGLNLFALIHPESRHLFREYTQKIQTNGVFEARTQQVCQDGSKFYAEWRGTAFSHLGKPSMLSIVRNVSSRVESEQLLNQHIETRTREQSTLLNISHALASTLEFRPGLILDQLREIVEYTQGGLFTLEDSTLVALAMRGSSQLEASPPISIHVQGPETLEKLFNGHQPIRIADLWSDAPQAQFLRSLLDDDAAVLLNGMKSWMWVPLAVRGRIIGGVGVAEVRKNHFSAHHADLALSVANQAAIAMVNAELNQQAQILAVLEERQSLARNLHDAINQSLFSAGLIAEVLPRLWDRDQSEARRSLEDLRRLTRGAQAEMRALLAELRPSMLTDSNLSDLLHLLSNAFTGRTNIPVAISATGEFILPTDVQVVFYRICQEALNNVGKHAKASLVELHLLETGPIFELRIHDNGQGFNMEQSFPGHYGLSMMRERAEGVGAVLTVVSQAGQGTELTLIWSPPGEVEK